jgi:riboflavin synthase
MLIPHTQQNVIIPKKNIGDHVNIEVDILAKMVERSFNGIYERLLNIEKSILSKDTK